MVATQVTEEAMLAARMSLFISDQGLLNAGISSVVYSNAIGATEGSLNIVNADTVTDERLRAELKEEEEKNQDALEAASDMAIALVKENLDRILKGEMTVSYRTGIFTINGVDIDEEALEKSIKDNVIDGWPQFSAQHGLHGEDGANFLMWAQAFQNNPTDPEIRAQALEQMASINPEAAHVVIHDAWTNTNDLTSDADINAIVDAKANANQLTSGEISVHSFVTDASDAESNRAAAQIDDIDTKVEIRTAQGFADAEVADLTGNEIERSFDMSAMFGESASGDMFAEVEPVQTINDVTPASAPTATI